MLCKWKKTKKFEEPDGYVGDTNLLQHMQEINGINNKRHYREAAEKTHAEKVAKHINALLKKYGLLPKCRISSWLSTVLCEKRINPTTPQLKTIMCPILSTGKGTSIPEISKKKEL